MTKQLNTRLPELTHNQIDRIADETGLTKTQIIIIAIDRLSQQELPPEILVTIPIEQILINN